MTGPARHAVGTELHDLLHGVRTPLGAIRLTAFTLRLQAGELGSSSADLASDLCALSSDLEAAVRQATELTSAVEAVADRLMRPDGGRATT